MNYNKLPNVIEMYEQYGIDESTALIIIGFISMERRNKLDFNRTLEKFNKEVIPIIKDLEGE